MPLVSLRSTALDVGSVDGEGTRGLSLVSDEHTQVIGEVSEIVRLKPGSAKGVTFMTIEDETDVANLVIWSKMFEKERRLILSTSLIACRGRLQREGEFLHLIAEHFINLSEVLHSVMDRDGDLRVRSGRGDEARIGTRDRIRGGSQEAIQPPYTMSERDETTIKVGSRNFH